MNIGIVYPYGYECQPGRFVISGGPLTLLASPERLESGWWSLLSAAEAEGEELALRDYYVARSPHAGLLWVRRPPGFE